MDTIYTVLDEELIDENMNDRKLSKVHKQPSSAATQHIMNLPACEQGDNYLICIKYSKTLENSLQPAVWWFATKLPSSK